MTGNEINPPETSASSAVGVSFLERRDSLSGFHLKAKRVEYNECVSILHLSFDCTN